MLMWGFMLSGPRASRALMIMSERDARGPEEYDQGRGRRAVAKAPADHPVDALAGPAHLLGPGLLHLPVVRRADDAGAGLVAQRHVRRPVGRPDGGGPVLDPGRRLDRSRAWPQIDDRRVAARRRPLARVVACRVAVDLLCDVDRAWRLPGRPALRTGLCRDHPGLRAALQAGDPADDLRRRAGQHLRHSLHAVPDRAHRLAV